jgi:hypothetical protein
MGRYGGFVIGDDADSAAFHDPQRFCCGDSTQVTIVSP